MHDRAQSLQLTAEVRWRLARTTPRWAGLVLSLWCSCYVGCSSATVELAPPEEDEVVDPTGGAGQRRRPASEVGRTSFALGLEIDLRTIPFMVAGHSRVTSTAAGSGGSRYVAGTFAGAITAGASVMTSRGGDDVFVARIDPDNQLVWIRTAGSSRTERGPTVLVEDDRIKVIAVTRGEIDCGGEPQDARDSRAPRPYNMWTTEMFFLCVFDPDGAWIEGSVFPTGAL
jgi:hypothetical protein